MSAEPVILAESTRSGIIECQYRGSVVVVDANANPLLALGNTTGPVFGRSANKPMQAMAMVRLGLDLPLDQLALATSSHSGEARHIALAQTILAHGQFTAADLRNAVFAPIGKHGLADMYRRGEEPSRLTSDCSGKHSAMLVTCRLHGWSTHDYLDNEHPLQRAITDTIADYASEQPAFVGVDGCGAPAHGLSLHGLARAYSRIAAKPDVVAQAMRAHPELVGGFERDVSLLMQALPGVIAKDGADGVLAVALPNGTTVALKMADASLTTRVPVALAALNAIGVDVSAATHMRTVPILGGGLQVGELHTTF